MDLKSQSLRIRIRQNASVKEKTLIRVVAETLKKLVQIYQIKSAEEIFSSFEIQALRYKLKECLNRLIFLEPLEFGQKAEDTIWKSIFYEPIRIFKRELKNKPSLINSKSLLLVGFQRHILGAIGYYQKLILRLQTEFRLSKEMCPDFQRFIPCEDDEEKEICPALKSWAFSCIQHSLLYIGDLYRYEHDIKCANSRVIATRYYNLVLQLNPSLGHAYNQLATLDTLSYYGLNAAYFYLKAQLCSHSFVQAKENLSILLERNVKRLRSVLDKESQMKKSGSNMSKTSLKTLRVKTSIIKYLNVWHLFIAAAEMSHQDIKQLALMCDDVLNILSVVLGFDRKLVPTLSSLSSSCSDNGVRPVTLNVKIVSEILFIAASSLDLMRTSLKTGSDQSQQDQIRFDLAHSFVLNLYGHVFNQCLVRVRDELRASQIEMAMLFQRYDIIRAVAADPPVAVLSTEPVDAIRSRRRHKVALSKRLVRARHDTEDTNTEEDLSEDDGMGLDHESNMLWDDQMSDDSSDSCDGPDGPRGFVLSDGDEDDETDFESNEEIHSQDEDDQIIRAIVGHNTVFGRQQQQPRASTRDLVESELHDGSRYCAPGLEQGLYLESPTRKSSKKRPTQLSPGVQQAPQQPVLSTQTQNREAPVKQSSATLVRCVHNCDLLQSLSVVLAAFHSMHTASSNSVGVDGDRDDDGACLDSVLDSFSRVSPSSPYLWKHLSVLLNFCENVLDDVQHWHGASSALDGSTATVTGPLDEVDPIQPCDHWSREAGSVRAMLPCVLPEDRDSSDSSLAMLDELSPPCAAAVAMEQQQRVQCSNIVHQVVTRLRRFLRCGHRLAALPHAPIELHDNVWSFSHSHNAPRNNLVSKSCINIFSNSVPAEPPALALQVPVSLTTTTTTTAPTSTSDKEKVMREMARLRLKNELLSNPESDDDDDDGDIDNTAHRVGKVSRSPSSDALRAVYLIPDVDYICTRLDAIKALVRSQRYIFVIPQALIQRLDRLKSHDHGARQAIKYFEAELQLNNEHIKVESAAGLRAQDQQCDQILDWPVLETTAVRLVDESVIKSGPGSDTVVTILTAAAPTLSDQFSEHYLARRIDFQSTIDL